MRSPRPPSPPTAVESIRRSRKLREISLEPDVGLFADHDASRGRDVAETWREDGRDVSRSMIDTRFFTMTESLTGCGHDRGPIRIAVAFFYDEIEAPRPRRSDRDGPDAPPSPSRIQNLPMRDAAKNGPKFASLYDRLRDVSSRQSPSRGEADMSLILLIAFWTGPDASRIERIFNSSVLESPKRRERDSSKSDHRQTLPGAADGPYTPPPLRPDPRSRSERDHRRPWTQSETRETPETPDPTGKLPDATWEPPGRPASRSSERLIPPSPTSSAGDSAPTRTGSRHSSRSPIRLGRSFGPS